MRKPTRHSIASQQFRPTIHAVGTCPCLGCRTRRLAARLAFAVIFGMGFAAGVLVSYFVMR